MELASDKAPAPEAPPLVEPRAPGSVSIVIFGASGDLASRKLIPALYDLYVDDLLCDFVVLGAARSPLSDEAFRESLLDGVDTHARHRPVERDTWDAFSRRLYYQPFAYDSASDMETLVRRLDRIEREHNFQGRRLYYLATPPSVFEPLVKHLGAAGLARPSATGFARVIIEKPFGTDLKSASSLNQHIGQVLDESQIFRIDHYLGKETVQNLLVLRFANGILEPLWNNKYVDHVQITGAETLGVEQRSAYFDRAGILRDMVQNHLLQLLALCAMEPPGSFAADAVRNEKLKVLQALRPVEASRLERRVARGQYDRGSIGGREVAAYAAEPGVSEDSRTETFVALELFVDNWRWSGVPFYLRCGKRLPQQVTEISIQFKAAPHRLFAETGLGSMDGNRLTIRIQPNEGMALAIGAKRPGASMRVAPISLDFRYDSAFGCAHPAAYERLLLDALTGDGTLFTRGDEVEASWRFISPIHEAWQSAPRPALYAAGSWGPSAGIELLARNGRAWHQSPR